MGTIISLEIAGMQLDWSRNEMGWDHGVLFQEHDRTQKWSNQIDYGYFTENDEDPGPMERAFCRKLGETIYRLELLGFNLTDIRQDYEDRTAYSEILIENEGDEQEIAPMNFYEFCDFVIKHPLKSLENIYIEDNDLQKVQGRFFEDPAVKRIPIDSMNAHGAYSELSYFGELLKCLHPYSILRILAENPENYDAEILWQYGPLVEGGYAEEADFLGNARREHTFLITTEGSSDSHILKHAFELLKPEIADFFRFIDMHDNYPFTGAGNLFKFAQGLAKIDVHNQILFLLDNDAEGLDIYHRLSSVELPANMRTAMLPELEEFRSFPTVGPTGTHSSDINRRAAAIECYLDLNLPGYPPAQVIWKNHKESLQIYHGALDHKESYTKYFLKQNESSLRSTSYDSRKLSLLLDSIVDQCLLIIGKK